MAITKNNLCFFITTVTSNRLPAFRANAIKAGEIRRGLREGAAFPEQSEKEIGAGSAERQAFPQVRAAEPR
jgi:hypothetical protein